MSRAIASVLDRIRREGGFRDKDIAQLATVSAMTVSRWVHGHRLPEARIQHVLAELRYVVDRLAELYSPEQVRFWLMGSGRIEHGNRPIDLVFTGQVERVLVLIDQESGLSQQRALDH